MSYSDPLGDQGEKVWPKWKKNKKLCHVRKNDVNPAKKRLKRAQSLSLSFRGAVLGPREEQGLEGRAGTWGKFW